MCWNFLFLSPRFHDFICYVFIHSVSHSFPFFIWSTLLQTKTRTHKREAPRGATKLYAEEVPEETKKLPDNIPRSIVAKASKVGPKVTELIRDFRKMMNPYTATNLRERAYNRLKDYIAVADKLGVTHIFAISQTDKNIVMKIGKTPEGPTIHFRVKEYSLSQQIKALQVSHSTSNKTTNYSTT